MSSGFGGRSGPSLSRTRKGFESRYLTEPKCGLKMFTQVVSSAAWSVMSDWRHCTVNTKPSHFEIMFANNGSLLSRGLCFKGIKMKK